MDRNKNERLWTHLHSLIILAQQGSFTAAARRLNVSKATVSLRITELEQSLGVRLVHRTTRSEEHTSELQSRGHLVCRLLLEKKKKSRTIHQTTRCTSADSTRKTDNAPSSITQS